MSGYLLDTCVVRHWYAGRPGVSARINALPDEMPVYLSVITRGEIEFAHTSQKSDATRQVEFRKWIRETFAVPMLDVTEGAAEFYAQLRRECFNRFDKKNKYLEFREDNLGAKCGIDENDLWLAAQAMERNLVLVTTDGMERIKEIVSAIGNPDRVQVWPDN
jgi:predicted nucleic acid-binding protein